MPVKKDEIKLEDILLIKDIQERIEKLQSLEYALSGQIEAKQKEINAMVSNAEKEIALLREKTEIWVHEQEAIIANRIIQLDSRESQIAIREKDLEIIHDENERLQREKAAFQDVINQVESERVALSEKQHAADLIKEQYEKKLQEISN